VSTSDQAQDQKFFNLFMVVIGALVAVAVTLFFIARTVGANTQVAWAKDDPGYVAEVDARIKPVGQVSLPGDLPAAPAGAVAAAPAAQPVVAEQSGEQVYNSTCIACHGAGIGGAPKYGDAASWAPHKAKGAATLHKHAIDGYQGPAGFMPPRGGNMALTDEEVMAAVDFMVGFK